MKKTSAHILLILFLLPGYRAQAQYHFVESKIWFNNGDSTNGWIDEAGLYSRPNRIRFQQNKNDNDGVFYTAAEVKAFRLHAANPYIGWIGYVDSAHAFILDQYSFVDPNGMRDSLFLQPLIVGKANLYSAIDHRNVKHFFIQYADKPAKELHYFNIQWTKEGMNVGIFQKVTYHFVQRNIYKQQLLAAFSDCNSVFEKLAKKEIHYTKSSLKKWFRRYNENHCRDD